MNASITLRTPADVAVAVPQILGFNPVDSIVLITFGPSPFHGRVDLGKGEAEAAEVADTLVEACLRNGTTSVLIAAYTDSVKLARINIDALAEAMGTIGVPIHDAIRVEGLECFNVAGELVATVSEANSLIGAMGPVRPSREAVAASVAAAQETEPALALLLADMPTVLAEVSDSARWVTSVMNHIESPDWAPAKVARLLWLIDSDVTLRDAACASIKQRSAKAHVAFWSSVVTRLANERVALAPLGLLAYAAWQAGDGALAWCVVDRGLSIDGDYQLLRLVAHVLDKAIPPSVMSETEG